MIFAYLAGAFIVLGYGLDSLIHKARVFRWSTSLLAAALWPVVVLLAVGLLLSMAERRWGWWV